MDGSAANDFNLGPGFLQQDRGFTGALAAADDGHLLSPELSEIVMLTGVAHNLGRQSPEFNRAEFLVRKSRGNHDMTGADNLAVVERQPKPSARCLNASDLSGVEIGNGALLKPAAVCDEFFEGQWRGPRESSATIVDIKRERSAGIGYVRGPPWRPEFHSFRHVPPPERHGLAEDHRFDLRRFEMGRKREAVRTGANDGDLASIIPSAHDVSVP